ncbi:hypothetical protein MRX96_024161 [Rhipicephalus microplus]
MVRALGHPTSDAPCKHCGGDHPPQLCKQRLYSEATTRSSVPQVEPPTVVSAEVQGAPALKILGEGEQGETIQAAPGEAERNPLPLYLGCEKAPFTPVVKGRGSSRARAAVAARELSTSASESSRSESTSPEYRRQAATAVVDDDSSSTTVKDSEIDAWSLAPCELCKSVACRCSELSDTSYPSTSISPIVREPVS